MEVKVSYPQSSLEDTINFITSHNRRYASKPDEVRQNIIQSIQELVDEFPRLHFIGRDGFYVWVVSYEPEGIDSDENIMVVDFMLDPAIISMDHKYIDTIFKVK